MTDGAQRTDRRVRVCHLVHSTKIGGAEVAAAALQARPPEGFDYRLAVLTAAPPAGAARAEAVAIERPDCYARGLNNPLSLIAVAAWVRRSAPDVLIASLWRSVLVGAALKLIRPRLTFVIFLHNTEYKNAADRLAHRLGLRLADAVFCDAEATGAAARARMRPGSDRRTPIHVVPLLARASDPAAAGRVARSRAPGPAGKGGAARPVTFIFWGRLAAQKRLDRSIRLLAELSRSTDLPLRLELLGPDEGEGAGLRALAERAGVAGSIGWRGPATWPQIRAAAAEADFFLQLSDFEGLGMSVVEAMQLGLVPVVTPVGQIGEFSRHGRDAIHYRGEREAVAELLDVFRDPARYRRLSAAAVAAWAEQPSLQDSFAAACRAVLVPRGSARHPGARRPHLPARARG